MHLKKDDQLPPKPYTRNLLHFLGRPLCFNLLADCTTAPRSPPPSSNITNSNCILWAKASASDIENYQNIVGQRLSTFPADLLNCGTVDCSFHREFLEEYANQFVSTLTSCAVHCFPIRSSSSPTLVGWKDSCQDDDQRDYCQRTVYVPQQQGEKKRIWSIHEHTNPSSLS